jgi:hypothetical protein
VTHQNNIKEQIVTNLKKTPIVQVVCEKLGIGRASYYRWRKEDKEFAEETDAAIDEGLNLVNDMAESQLLSAIRDQNMTAIIFWLKNHHRSYTNRIELNGTINHTSEELTKEQEILVHKALVNAGLLIEGESSDENN